MQQSSLIYLNNLISQQQNSSNDEELNKKLQMLKLIMVSYLKLILTR